MSPLSGCDMPKAHPLSPCSAWQLQPCCTGCSISCTGCWAGLAVLAGRDCGRGGVPTPARGPALTGHHSSKPSFGIPSSPLAVGAGQHPGAELAGGSGPARAVTATYCASVPAAWPVAGSWKGVWIILGLEERCWEGQGGSPCQEVWPELDLLCLKVVSVGWAAVSQPAPGPPPQPCRKGLMAGPYLQLHFKDVKLKPVIYSPHTRRSN